MDGVAPAILPPVPTPLLPAVAAVFAALAAVVVSGGPWRVAKGRILSEHVGDVFFLKDFW